MAFAFIETDIQCEFPLPADIVPDFQINRAASEQINAIRPKLLALQSFLVSFPFPLVYECFPLTAGGGKMKRAPIEEWRYSVVNFSDETNALAELRHSFSLLEKDISIGFEFRNWCNQVAQTGNPSMTFFHFVHRRCGPPVLLTEPDVKMAARYLGLIRAEKKGAPVLKALEQFFSLGGLSPTSSFQTLGCFTVLESLLTHKPSRNETGDSITRQLKTKIALLEKMFETPLDFSAFLLPAGSKQWNNKAKEAIWTKLYEYRSFLAHGSTFSFKGDFPSLVSPTAVQAFVRQVTKQVLVVALERTEFLEDLKEV